MDIDIKQQVKEILLKENLAMTELVNILNKDKPKEEQTTATNLGNKLTRGTIKYSEILDIFDVLGYDVALQKRNDTNLHSSKSASSGYITKSYSSGVAGATTGFLLGGVAGSIVGGVLGSTFGKAGTITGSRKVIKQQAERLDLEYDIEINIEIIIKGIVEDALYLTGEMKSKLEDYLKSTELPTSLKYQSIYRTIYKIVSSEYNDIEFLSFITELRNIYAHGGFIDVSDEMLNDLFKASRYYISEFFINTKID